MKGALTLLIVNIPTMLCVVASAYIATNGIRGWGWLLFVAVLLAHTVSYDKSKSDD